MKRRYGDDYVCQIGTYTTLQMRSALKELCRVYNVEDNKTRNYLSQLIDEDNTQWSSLFIDAIKKPKLKSFVEDYGYLINDSRLILNAIKTSSVHACATLIVPKTDAEGIPTTIYEWIPMRKDSSGLLISEWEGNELADAGFLKEDILATQQMTKISKIFQSIQETNGVSLCLKDIPLDDKGVFDLFKKGFTGDTFHFKSSGLSAYSKEVRPDSIHELIAMIALYRPGAMSSNAHHDYVKLKFGEIEPEYDFGLTEVTKDTFGLYIYQEQIMKAAQILGDFSLIEADGVRKAMGKKIKSKMDEYKVRFIDSAIRKGCPETEAQEIWTKMEVFAEYGFNKSHAAAYAITGYICNWLKFHYPMAFWTVAFQYAKEEQIPKYVHEIHQTGNISIVPPALNKSQREFFADYTEKRIYWSINKIKFVGDAALEYILSEREMNGQYYSLEEFLERMDDHKGEGRSPINKKVLTNLVFAGAFDEICQISRPQDRLGIIEEYYKIRKESLPEEFSKSTAKTAPFWELMQVEVSQLGMISYPSIISRSQNSKIASMVGSYYDGESFQDREICKDGSFVLVAGRVIDVIKRVDKNEKPYCDIVIINNNVEVKVRFFSDIWTNNVKNSKRDYSDWSNTLGASKGRILLITGKVNDFGNSRTVLAIADGRGTSITEFDLF